jgi:hypothetical protein
VRFAELARRSALLKSLNFLPADVDAASDIERLDPAEFSPAPARWARYA